MKHFSCFIFLWLICTQVEAQMHPRTRLGVPDLPSVSTSATVPEGTTPKILKKPGHYSLADWQHLVDSLWGPGLPTATKLSVFDTFWNAIDRWWGGFPNTSINWDSLRNVYRPIVAGGVSRGRFAGILSRLTRELLEWHAGALDTGIDSTMGYDSDIYSSRAYPGYVAFHYEPSIPILNINLLFWRTVFGAGLTLVHDSTLVVYNVMPNHPLGLQPGDIILGYDDKRWQQLLQEWQTMAKFLLLPPMLPSHLGEIGNK